MHLKVACLQTTPEEEEEGRLFAVNLLRWSDLSELMLDSLTCATPPVLRRNDSSDAMLHLRCQRAMPAPTSDGSGRLV